MKYSEPKLDLELATKIIDFLNSLLETDRDTISSLINHRIPCSKFLADHPTIQVDSEDRVGLLGLLNGLCGKYTEKDEYYEFGPIMMVLDEKNNQIAKFKLTKNNE